MYLVHLWVVGFPSGGASVGRYVRKAIEILKENGPRHGVHAMGTEIEAERRARMFDVVGQMDEALGKPGAQRVTVNLKVDHCRDKPTDLASKARSAIPP